MHPQIISVPTPAWPWGQCTVGCISHLLSPQKPALPHRAAERSFHWTITQFANNSWVNTDKVFDSVIVLIVGPCDGTSRSIFRMFHENFTTIYDCYTISEFLSKCVGQIWSMAPDHRGYLPQAWILKKNHPLRITYILLNGLLVS